MSLISISSQDIPAMDTIKMLLDTMMRNNPLLNWNIYQEKSGSVVIKLRFGGDNNGVTDPNTNAHFRRKSDSQLNRDHQRAQEHHMQRNQVKKR